MRDSDSSNLSRGTKISRLNQEKHRTTNKEQNGCLFTSFLELKAVLAADPNEVKRYTLTEHGKVHVLDALSIGTDESWLRRQRQSLRPRGYII